MTVTIDTAEYARELADAIEEGLQGDGTHIGISDSALAAKALRFFAQMLTEASPAGLSVEAA
jgi:hypothetical protein